MQGSRDREAPNPLKRRDTKHARLIVMFKPSKTQGCTVALGAVACLELPICCMPWLKVIVSEPPLPPVCTASGAACVDVCEEGGGSF